jgi:hypothetical protein
MFIGPYNEPNDMVGVFGDFPSGSGVVSFNLSKNINSPADIALSIKSAGTIGNAVAPGATDIFNISAASASFGGVFVDPNPNYANGAVSVSTTAGNTQIVATFTPNFGVSLSDAAAIGGFSGFDWMQTVVTDPYPPTPADPALGELTAPYPDPPEGGYTDQPGTAGRYPYYWYASTEDVSSANVDGEPTPIETSSTLLFTDIPAEPQLTSNQYLEFDTTLVGIVPGDGPCPTSDMVVNGACVQELYEISWKDNFNGTVGGIGVRSNSEPVDPGSGTGGITILSESYFNYSPVPEPSVYGVLSLSLAAVGLRFRLRRLQRLSA